MKQEQVETQLNSYMAKLPTICLGPKTSLMDTTEVNGYLWPKFKHKFDEYNQTLEKDKGRAKSSCTFLLDQDF